MTPQEIAAYVFENLDPQDTAEFATALRAELEAGYSDVILEGIADELASVGITIADIKCKAHPD